ncbi:hypothetical protein ILYODFUR_032882 [Ilyodon furcidens]|uniref:Uncharacterized protein n=1 Tax=Ilyodon furcidens TaxID=33524 RepID=A0ABV0TZQ8_9TELE
MRPQLNFLAYMQNTMCRTGKQFRVGEKVDGAKYKNVLEENSNSSNVAKATTEWFGLKPIEVLKMALNQIDNQRQVLKIDAHIQSPSVRLSLSLRTETELNF